MLGSKHLITCGWICPKTGGILAGGGVSGQLIKGQNQTRWHLAKCPALSFLEPQSWQTVELGDQLCVRSGQSSHLFDFKVGCSLNWRSVLVTRKNNFQRGLFPLPRYLRDYYCFDAPALGICWQAGFPKQWLLDQLSLLRKNATNISRTMRQWGGRRVNGVGWGESKAGIRPRRHPSPPPPPSTPSHLWKYCHCPWKLYTATIQYDRTHSESSSAPSDWTGAFRARSTIVNTTFPASGKLMYWLNAPAEL